MDIINLASGSAGNCTYISSGTTSILLDNGLGIRTLENRSKEAGIDLSKISAVVITHEHSDHIKGVSAFCEKYSKKLYIHEKSYNASLSAFGKIRPENEDFTKDFLIGDLCLTPFRVPHDAVMTFGYIIDDGKAKFGYATDLGIISESVMKKLATTKALVLESNHDEELLIKNPMYPNYLKKRILGTLGHLSNETSAKAMVQLVNSGVEKIMLAHLSEKNNYPELAFDVAVNTLKANGIKEGVDVKINVAQQKCVSEHLRI